MGFTYNDASCVGLSSRELESKGVQASKLLSVEPKIVDNNLLIRAQTMLSVERHESMKLMTEGLLGILCKHQMLFHNHRCPYPPPKRLDSKEQDISDLPDYVKAMIRNSSSAGHHLSPNLDGCFDKTFQCPHCLMELTLDCIDVQGRGEYTTETIFIVTKWFNLGHGVDEDDPAWRRHSYRTEREEELDLTPPVRGIRNLFEQDEGSKELSVEALAVENIHRLFSRRKVQSFEFRPIDGRQWKLHASMPDVWYLSPSGGPEWRLKNQLLYVSDLRMWT